MMYFQASSGQEALKWLTEAQGKGIILAGGSDVMVDIKAEKINPSALIDITKASDLIGISEEEGYLRIGAATTLTDIACSPLVRRCLPSLAQGCGSVGSLQIRNSATLTGNVVSAQPAGDGAMALAALAPIFVVLSEDGERRLTMDEMYAGFGKSAIDPSRELITKIMIPMPKDQEAASFIRLELRKSLSLPMLNCSAMLHCEGDVITWARLRMGPVGVGPVQAKVAEDYLVGKTFSTALAQEAGHLALEDANPRSNPLRGSREYRMDVLPVIICRALETCWAQLQGIEGKR